MTDQISYKKNFLKEVIVRIDFLSPILDLAQEFPIEIAEQVKKEFPIAEPTKEIGQSFQISPMEISASQPEEIKAWNFFDRKREKVLKITQNSMLIIYYKYKSYEILKKDFLGALSTLLGFYKNTQGQRLGLRYINNIALENGDPLNWDEYLDNRMLSIFQLYPNKETISRAIQVLEFNFNDFNLRYQYGMHNPDYPATIIKKIFISDLDAYYQGVQDRVEIESNLEKFHEKIQELFELSITNELRRIMNEK